MHKRKSLRSPLQGPGVCPWCGSEDTELLSPFGQTLMTSQYYCWSCHSGFERVRWQGRTTAGTCR